MSSYFRFHRRFLPPSLEELFIILDFPYFFLVDVPATGLVRSISLGVAYTVFVCLGLITPFGVTLIGIIHLGPKIFYLFCDLCARGV